MSEIFTEVLKVETRGKGLYEITDALDRALGRSGIGEGVLTVFCRHTSASLVITENADPTARADVHAFLERMAPETAPYTHTLEGREDAASHIKAAMARTSESIPVFDRRLCLGTWQGVFLWEHRSIPHTREVVISLVGRPV